MENYSSCYCYTNFHIRKTFSILDLKFIKKKKYNALQLGLDPFISFLIFKFKFIDLKN